MPQMHPQPMYQYNTDENADYNDLKDLEAEIEANREVDNKDRLEDPLLERYVSYTPPTRYKNDIDPVESEQVMAYAEGGPVEEYFEEESAPLPDYQPEDEYYGDNSYGGDNGGGVLPAENFSGSSDGYSGESYGDDLTAAVTAARVGIDYGRTQYGLNDMGLEDQGAIPDPQQPQAQPDIMGYLAGKDAADPGTMAGLMQQIDPQGAMDESTRNLLAVQAASEQGPEAAWPVLQYLRQKGEAWLGVARAALEGTQNKPPNIEEAAMAANKYFASIPDGNNVQVTPTQGGLQVSVQPLGGQPDDGYDREIEGTDQMRQPGLGQQVDAGLKSAGAAVKSFVLNPAQALEWFKSSQTDKVLEQGVFGPDEAGMIAGAQQQAASPVQVQPSFTPQNFGPDRSRENQQGPDTFNERGERDQPGQVAQTAFEPRQQQAQPAQRPQRSRADELMIEANRLFPWTSQERERNQYLAQNLMKGREYDSKENVAGIARDGRAYTADRNFEGKLYSTDASGRRTELLEDGRNNRNIRTNDGRLTQQQMRDRAAMERTERAQQGAGDRAILNTVSGAGRNQETFDRARQITQRQQAQQAQQSSQGPVKVYQGRQYIRGPNGEAIDIGPAKK